MRPSGGLLSERRTVYFLSGAPTTARLMTNTVPLFLALGRYDYAVPHTMWSGVKVKVPQLTHRMFERSGHFPMLEEDRLFDTQVVQWLKRS
jgi:pimeloyl-ACP methyl ester carboxylesterase